MEKTKKVSDDMISHGAAEWDDKTRFISLVEEIGELAHAILMDNNEKPGKNRKSEIVDSLCDALFMIFRIAEVNKIDLNKKYPELLEQFSKRYKDGKFVGNYGLQKD